MAIQLMGIFSKFLLQFIKAVIKEVISLTCFHSSSETSAITNFVVSRARETNCDGLHLALLATGPNRHFETLKPLIRLQVPNLLQIRVYRPVFSIIVATLACNHIELE